MMHRRKKQEVTEMEYPKKASKKVMVEYCADVNGYVVYIDGAMSVPCTDVKVEALIDDDVPTYGIIMFNENGIGFAQARTKKIIFQ